jgi:putative chitinase
MLLQDPKAFFEVVRIELFGGVLSQDQVDGINAVVAAWQDLPVTDWRWIASALATAYHETVRTMQPIAEYGRGQGRAYSVRCGPTSRSIRAAASCS